MFSCKEFVIDVVLIEFLSLCPDAYSNVGAHPLRPAAIVHNEVVSAPDEAADVEAEAPTDEDAEGMDDDEDDGDGGDEIPGTQDDPLSLPILDSSRVEVEEPDHEKTGSDDEV